MVQYHIQDTRWGGGLTLLQIFSGCILQPQLIVGLRICCHRYRGYIWTVHYFEQNIYRLPINGTFYWATLGIKRMRASCHWVKRIKINDIASKLTGCKFNWKFMIEVFINCSMKRLYLQRMAIKQINILLLGVTEDIPGKKINDKVF